MSKRETECSPSRRGYPSLEQLRDIPLQDWPDDLMKYVEARNEASGFSGLQRGGALKWAAEFLVQAVDG